MNICMNEGHKLWRCLLFILLALATISVPGCDRNPTGITTTYDAFNKWLRGFQVSDNEAAAPQLHKVGFTTQTMNLHAVEQHKDNWCWAACIQMVLSTKGIEVSQQDIVMKAFGTMEDRPADPETIKRNLTEWPIRRGNQTVRLNVQIGFSTPSDHEIIQSLSKGTPMIVGIFLPDSRVGHALVITAAAYVDTPGGPSIKHIILRDPGVNVDRDKLVCTSGAIKFVHMYYLVDEVESR